MEANWIAERSMLRHLLPLYPTWSSTEVARCLGRSASWAKKMAQALPRGLYLLYLCFPSVGIAMDMPGMSMAARAAAGITIKGRIMSWSSCSSR
jgi:hypothetical protein